MLIQINFVQISFVYEKFYLRYGITDGLFFVIDENLLFNANMNQLNTKLFIETADSDLDLSKITMDNYWTKRLVYDKGNTKILFCATYCN